MSTVSIVPVPGAQGGSAYQATSGERHASGATPGMALDAITGLMGAEEGPTLVLLLRSAPDSHFSASQRDRLADLMAKWRTARDTGVELPGDEQGELDALVKAELHASGRRANALASELTK